MWHSIVRNISSVCVCSLWSHKVPFGLFPFSAGGMRPARKHTPTKLCVMVEARSDQPGVPAFENLSMAKAVQYVVSALRVFAIKGLMQRQVISVLLWRPWRFRGVIQFCNSPEPLGTWLPRSPCGEWHSHPYAKNLSVSGFMPAQGDPAEWPLWTR